MASTKEITIEDKLRALYDLQIIDKHIDRIRAMRGELPLEVEDLEDEIAGLQIRSDKFQEEIGGIEAEVKNKKILIKDAEEKIAKYEAQQKNVRNNREFDAISKEIEYQGLEIELANKRIKEYKATIENKNGVIATSDEKLAERKSHLEFKKSELDTILGETQKEEDFLLGKSEEFGKEIEERLLTAYKRIRSNSRNGLAVVSIERGASGGSFFVIPPQRQLEIAQRKKIITDEHSGRILVDPDLAKEEEDRILGLLADLKK
jgi:predicted  nucleic acid-binding Zn-ribbon protein